MLHTLAVVCFLATIVRAAPCMRTATGWSLPTSVWAQVSACAWGQLLLSSVPLLPLAPPALALTPGGSQEASGCSFHGSCLQKVWRAAHTATVSMGRGQGREGAMRDAVDGLTGGESHVQHGAVPLSGCC